MNNLIEKNLKWIFVSGKGGVGKTTTSSCIASILSEYKDNILLISTDPAHSLSDIFSQQFDNEPILINGYNNLFCMEFDNSIYLQNKTFNYLNEQFKDLSKFHQLFINIPGIEDAMGYIALMNQVSKYNYSTIIFDTAPTGNTLKLLAYPSLILETIKKLNNSKLSLLFKQFITMIYNINDNIDVKIENMIKNIELINTKLTDQTHTEFISVLIPEFLSVFETERLIQTLFKFNINCELLILNQLIEEPDDKICEFLKKRKENQLKYINMINDLYEDFEIIKLPLLTEEIRYPKNIKDFSKKYFQINQIKDENISLIAESLM